MTDSDQQAAAVDLMAQNMVTHLIDKLQEKGLLTKEEVDGIYTKSETGTEEDIASGSFADAGTK